MTGPTDDHERQPSAAQSTTSTTTPIDTDDYIHQMMVRLSPYEDVVRHLRPGKHIFRYFVDINTNFQSFLSLSTLKVAQFSGYRMVRSILVTLTDPRPSSTVNPT